MLVIDDVGLPPMADRRASAAFFDVVNTRYEKQHPTLVTTNRGLPDWGEIFGDSVVAAAILDRLMHNAIVFNIRGPSWRLREHHGLEIAHHQPRPLTSDRQASPDHATRIPLIADRDIAARSHRRAVGALGEDFVVGWERARLCEAGRSERVERLSVTQRDGLGSTFCRSTRPTGRRAHRGEGDNRGSETSRPSQSRPQRLPLERYERRLLAVPGIRRRTLPECVTAAQVRQQGPPHPGSRRVPGSALGARGLERGQRTFAGPAPVSAPHWVKGE